MQELSWQDLDFDDLSNMAPRERSNTWPSQPAWLQEHNAHYLVENLPNQNFLCAGSSGATDSPDSFLSNLPKLPPGLASRKKTKNDWGNISYADLITLAILSCPEKRLTLSQIYDWFVINIPYFRDRADTKSSAGWKNSIRHNLSLHDRFIRTPHENSKKSSYWTIDPNAGSKSGCTSSVGKVSITNGKAFLNRSHSVGPTMFPCDIQQWHKGVPLEAPLLQKQERLVPLLEDVAPTRVLHNSSSFNDLSAIISADLASSSQAMRPRAQTWQVNNVAGAQGSSGRESVRRGSLSPNTWQHSLNAPAAYSAAGSGEQPPVKAENALTELFVDSMGLYDGLRSRSSLTNPYAAWTPAMSALKLEPMEEGYSNVAAPGVWEPNAQHATSQQAVYCSCRNSGGNYEQ